MLLNLSRSSSTPPTSELLSRVELLASRPSARQPIRSWWTQGRFVSQVHTEAIRRFRATTGNVAPSYNATVSFPYKDIYTYDTVDRIANFGAANAGNTAGTNVYTYPVSGAGSVRPHAVSSIVTAGGTDAYVSDNRGNRTR